MVGCQIRECEAEPLTLQNVCDRAGEMERSTRIVPQVELDLLAGAVDADRFDVTSAQAQVADARFAIPGGRSERYLLTNCASFMSSGHIRFGVGRGEEKARHLNRPSIRERFR